MDSFVFWLKGLSEMSIFDLLQKKCDFVAKEMMGEKTIKEIFHSP